MRTAAPEVPKFVPWWPNNQMENLPDPATLDPVCREAATAAGAALEELRTAAVRYGTSDPAGNGSRPGGTATAEDVLATDEALASSRIEGVETTREELQTTICFPLRGRRTREKAHERLRTEPAGETAANRRALLEGSANAARRPAELRGRAVSHWWTTASNRFVRTTMQRRMPVRQGTRCWIGGPAGIAYTPPDAPRVIRDRLRDLWRFVHEPDEPLVRIALAHYQYESIHPYGDGNGRTGRGMLALQMITAGILPGVVCPLSREIFEHRDEYYALFTTTRSSSRLEPWTTWLLERLRAAATRGCERLESRERAAGTLRRRAAGVDQQDADGLGRLAHWVALRECATVSEAGRSDAWTGRGTIAEAFSRLAALDGTPGFRTVGSETHDGGPALTTKTEEEG